MSSGLPSGFKVAKPKTPGKTSENVSSSYNKSGVALTGPGGSGTFSYKKVPFDYYTALQKGDMNQINKSKIIVGEAGSSGKNKPGTIKVGSGDTTHYVDVPKPHTDRGSASTSTSNNRVTAQNAGLSRPNPAVAKKSLASALSVKTTATQKTTKAPENSTGLDMSYFMRLAATSGKTNAYRRAYGLWKNYKKTGKLPSARVRRES